MNVNLENPKFRSECIDMMDKQRKECIERIYSLREKRKEIGNKYKELYKVIYKTLSSKKIKRQKKKEFKNFVEKELKIDLNLDVKEIEFYELSELEIIKKILNKF